MLSLVLTIGDAAPAVTVAVQQAGDGVATWLSAIGTIAASVIALGLGLGAREWLQRPKLRLAFDPEAAADRVMIPTVADCPEAHVRLRAINDGKTAAKNVQVTLTGVSTWAGNPGRWIDGKFEMHGRAFVWSNTRGLASAVDLPPGGERYLALLAIPRDWENQGCIQMALKLDPTGMVGGTERLSAGAWSLTFELSADNVSATTWHVAVTFNGVWPDNPPERIWEEVGVTPPSAERPQQPPQPTNNTPAARLVRAVAEDAAGT